MNTVKMTSALCGLAAATLLLGACATPGPATSWEGLDLVAQKKFDAVYLKRDADLVRYTEIMLDPLQVSFDRNWDPRPGYTSLQRADTGRIQRALADEFRKVFEQTLTADGRFRLVTEAGPATLHIQPAIVDLYITAPDMSMQTAGRVVTYTVDPGRMTLAADFRDGATGTLLGRVVDEKQGMDKGYLQVTNVVTNTADARRALQQWANAIRDGLDAVKTMAPANR